MIVGAPGAPNGVTELDDDPFPAPAVFMARICTSYAVPFTRFATVSGLIVVPADTQLDHEPVLTRYS